MGIENMRTAVFRVLAASVVFFPTYGIAEETSDTAEDTDGEAEYHPSYESVVVAKRPLSKDRTEDAVSVDGDTLRNSSRHGVLDALSTHSADLYVSSGGMLHGVGNGATGSMHIRGLGGSPNSQVLVVEDGVPDYQGIFGHPIPDAYVPFLVDEALVIKGGDSVLYGTNAMGGAIVIRSRVRETDGYELFNDAAYGSFSTIRETVAGIVRSGKTDASAAFHALSTDGHRKGAGGADMIGIAAVRGRLTPSLKLGLRNKIIHLRGADPGPASHPYEDHWYDVWRDNVSLHLEHEHKGVRVNVTPYLNLGIHQLYDGFHSIDHVEGGHAELAVKPHSTMSLLLGIAAEHTDGKIEDLKTGERTAVNDITDVSLYHQLTFSPIRALSFVLGTRELFSAPYGFVWLYKAGAHWDIGKGFFVRGRIARNFRQPTIRELYLPYPTANPDLKPEIALNADFGAGYTASHFEISCTGYRTSAKNIIKYFGVWPSAEVVNIDHSVVWGVEGAVGAKDLGPISIFVTGNWQDVGRYTRQNPNAKINFSVDASKQFLAHFLSGGVSGEWVHGLYMADYERKPIEDVFVMDMSFRYRYSVPNRNVKLEPYVFLRNFLDRDYAYVEDYPMPRFNIEVGLKVEI